MALESSELQVDLSIWVDVEVRRGVVSRVAESVERCARGDDGFKSCGWRLLATGDTGARLEDVLPYGKGGPVEGDPVDAAVETNALVVHLLNLSPNKVVFFIN